MNKRSSNHRKWRLEMRQRGQTVFRHAKHTIGEIKPSEEYLDLLRSLDDSASDQDKKNRTSHQDKLYWEMFWNEKPITREWSDYGKKHWDRISKQAKEQSWMGNGKERCE